MNKENQNNDFEEMDAFLRWHLDSDQFDVPDIPLKRSRMDRLIRYLCSPADNPFEHYINHAGSLTVLALSPILVGVAFIIFQLVRIGL